MLVKAKINNFHGVVLPSGASLIFSFCVVCHLGETVKLYSFPLCGALFARNWNIRTGVWLFYTHTTFACAFFKKIVLPGIVQTFKC